MQTYTLKNSAIALNEQYDVIVCGGGPAGCAAATAAAREGAKTLLLETSGMLGGMGTSGLVNAFTNIYDGIRCIHSGLCERVVKAASTQQEKLVPSYMGLIGMDFEKLKMEYDRMVTEAGADVLFHSHVCGVEMKDERNIDVVLVANKAGLTAYRAKTFIDCTGDADLYAWAGKEYLKGDKEGHLQPGTMCFIVSGIDEEGFKVMDDPYYNGEGLKKHALLHKMMDEGKYYIPDDHIVYKRIAPGTFSFNAGHVYGVDCTDPASLSWGQIEGRRIAWNLKNAYTEYAPCWKDSQMMQTGATLGVRESRRIIGDYTFTVEDYLNRQSFPDEVLRGKYHIDVHEEVPGMVRDTSKIYEHYTEGESYGVPYRVMCPRDLDNVLVAGRTMSSDRITNGTLRIMPCCLNAGEAVGIAAKLACDMAEVNIHKVDTQELRKRLISHGAYLPKLPTDTF